MLHTKELMPARSPIERLPEEWEAVLASWGEPKFRALQVFRWIHKRGVLDPEQMTDLSKSLRAKIAAEGLRVELEVAHLHLSEDTTRKMLVRLHDGKEIETVLLPQKTTGIEDVQDDSEQDDDAVDVTALDAANAAAPDATNAAALDAPMTQCISTQVGCAMACVFCASGIAGLKRHLSAGEIIAQLILGRSCLEPNERLRNVVLMGMGEPLHNYDNVARALVLMTHPEGLGLSARRVTLSTSGLVPEIDRLGRDFDGQVQLAVSLHAVTDERRSSMMPINRKYPLAELLAALARYPMPKRRRITIEYTLVKGINDSLEEADALARLLRPLRTKVNLIPMNPVSDNPLGPSDWSRVDAFQDRLRAQEVSVFVRRRRGQDIAAACGQLTLPGAKKTVRVRLPTASQ